MQQIISRKSLFYALLLTWFVVGCRSLPPSLTPPLPSAVPIATATLSLLPSVTPSPVPPTPTNITVFSSENIIKFITTTVQPRLYDTYLSPDGTWQAEVKIYDCIQIDDPGQGGLVENAYEQLMLINRRDGTEQLIASQFLYCGGLGAAGLAGLFWSSNSRYFYYTDAREGVPEGCGSWAQPIDRLEVATMKIDHLGGGPRSPDGTKYATWQGKEILLWDIEQGEITRWSAAVPDVMPGPIAWSPDNQSLVYLQFEDGCPFSGWSYVVHINLTTNEQKVLLESDVPTFSYVMWEVPERLILSDIHGAKWLYHFTSGTLEQIP